MRGQGYGGRVAYRATLHVVIPFAIRKSAALVLTKTKFNLDILLFGFRAWIACIGLYVVCYAKPSKSLKVRLWTRYRANGASGLDSVAKEEECPSTAAMIESNVKC